MTRPPDRVEMLTGIVHLPAEFREVARFANAAGRDGFEVADVETGVDLKAFVESNDLRTYITITYKEKPDAANHTPE